MEADWSVLLTSDFSFDVVAVASLVDPAGVVPTGLTGVVEFAVSDIVGFFGVDMSLFLQPPISKTEAIVTQSRAFDFFMAGLSIFGSFYKLIISTLHAVRCQRCIRFLVGQVLSTSYVCQRTDAAQ